MVAAASWLRGMGYSRIFLMCSSAGAPIGGSALDRLPEVRGYMARNKSIENALAR